MNALMVGFLAAAVVSLGSRWWLLAVAAQQQPAHRFALIPVIATASIAAALSAAFGATVAAQFAGPGMLLLLAIALGMAAAGMAWPARPLADPPRVSMQRLGPGLILLCAAMVSDSVPFILFAVAAWTDEPLLAAIGGGAGLIGAAMAGPMLLVSDQPLPAWLHHSRTALALLLVIIAAVAAVIALGLA